MTFLFRILQLELHHSIFQGIVNKWYAKMWLGRPCRCPMRFKKLHFAPRGKNIFLKNNISLTWHSLVSLFCYYPPLKEDLTLHFNIFESPLYKDTLCQVWLKLAKWFLRRRFFKDINVFSLCGYCLPLKKGMALNLNKFEFPLSIKQEYFVSCLVEIGPAVLEKIFKSCQYFSIFAIISP
mgnify:CR=1 FL=1